KVSSVVSYFNNRSSNQLVGYPLPPTAGFTSIQSNFPATVQNTGIEVEVTTINIHRSVFSWNTSLNLTIPMNKLVDFPGLSTSAPQYAERYVVGEPLNISRLYRYTGIDPATGMYQFEDTNDDGAYTIEDRNVIRFLGRKYYGGLSNTLKFKGVQLDFLFEFVKQ